MEKGDNYLPPPYTPYGAAPPGGPSTYPQPQWQQPLQPHVPITPYPQPPYYPTYAAPTSPPYHPQQQLYPSAPPQPTIVLLAPPPPRSPLWPFTQTDFWGPFLIA
ncbi:hypothetical protein HDV00_006073, partial [Rhizophlyctis rosea]